MSEELSSPRMSANPLACRQMPRQPNLTACGQSANVPGMSTTTVLLDLDDTLVIEQPGARDAFLAACERATAKHGCAAAALHEAVLKNARNLWYTSPSRAYIESIGISSWEGLWAESPRRPEPLAFASWGPTYRVWLDARRPMALSMRAADELADAYRKERVPHHFFPERASLDALRGGIGWDGDQRFPRAVRQDPRAAVRLLRCDRLSSDVGVGSRIR